METETSAPSPHLVSVVIPVYQGERTLAPVVEELAASVADRVSPAGTPLPRHRGRARARLRPRRLRRHRPRARRGPRLGAPGLAEPQLRPARGDPGRHRRLRRRVGRHHGRGRPARPRGDRRPARHGDGPSRPTSSTPGPTNEPPHGALRNVASRGAKWLVDRLAKGADAGVVLQLPARARRGRPLGRGLRRPRHLPRRRDRLGRQPHRHLPGRDAQRGRPSLRLHLPPAGQPLLAPRALQRHPTAALGQRARRRGRAARPGGRPRPGPRAGQRALAGARAGPRR